MNSRFTFVAYKPSSSDYCRNCLMASYSSDHVVENMLDAEQLVQRWASVLHKNMNLDCNEAGYRVHVFKDGILVWDEQYSTWDGDGRFEFGSDEYHAAYDEREARENAALEEINSLHTSSQVMAERMQAAQQEARAKVKRKQEEKEMAEAKERRRLEYEKLSKEFKQ